MHNYTLSLCIALFIVQIHKKLCVFTDGMFKMHFAYIWHINCRCFWQKWVEGRRAGAGSQETGDRGQGTRLYETRNKMPNDRGKNTNKTLHFCMHNCDEIKAKCADSGGLEKKSEYWSVSIMVVASVGQVWSLCTGAWPVLDFINIIMTVERSTPDARRPTALILAVAQQWGGRMYTDAFFVAA